MRRRGNGQVQCLAAVFDLKIAYKIARRRL